MIPSIDDVQTKIWYDDLVEGSAPKEGLEVEDAVASSHGRA